MALTTTVAGASSDSYCTVAEADTFVAWKQSATWTAASDATKESVLKAAVSVMDELKLRYQRATSTQALRWPTGAHYDSSGTLYIPERVKRAQAYLGLLLLEEPDARGSDERVKSVGVSGSFSVTFADGGQSLPTEITELLEKDLFRSGAVGSGEWDSARRGFV